MDLMNIKELKELIDIVTSRESIEELEIEKSGVRLRIKRASNNSGPSVTAAVAPAAMLSVAPSQPHPSVPVQIPAESEELVYIKSPIVGTFYTAASPGAEPFVSLGSVVQKGTVLCIVEAMKLMNEIESDVTGEIVSILVKNGQPVEYGEKLFALRPS
jgi:acetyl-CoA carboxylase biotin carboxyl carrier protein